MAPRNSDVAGGPGEGEDLDTALRRLLQDVRLDELHVPVSSGSAERQRLDFETLRETIAAQLRERIERERQRRREAARLRAQLSAAAATTEATLDRFVRTLLDLFHGGGAVHLQQDAHQQQRQDRERTWEVRAWRAATPASAPPEPVIFCTLALRGVDRLDRGQPALECRVGTVRNPRLVDFAAGASFAADLEDALCRAYQDIVGSLRLAPAPQAGLNLDLDVSHPAGIDVAAE